MASFEQIKRDIQDAVTEALDPHLGYSLVETINIERFAQEQATRFREHFKRPDIKVVACRGVEPHSIEMTVTIPLPPWIEITIEVEKQDGKANTSI